MTRCDFAENWVTSVLYGRALERLGGEVPWTDVAGNRLECFMARDLSKVYSYGKGVGRRVYEPVEFHPVVELILHELNARMPAFFNVCVLNRYLDERNHLGWHADDSPEQDPDHSIAVVSFGATREIWTKKMGNSGHVPPEDRFMLTPGSLFIMPPRYQETHLHRIPKHTAKCGERISLTFRKLDR